MPRKASGRRRGRPEYNWHWASTPLCLDPDWYVLGRLLMRRELGTQEWRLRPLIRKILATDPLLTHRGPDYPNIHGLESPPFLTMDPAKAVGWPPTLTNDRHS